MLALISYSPLFDFLSLFIFLVFFSQKVSALVIETTVYPSINLSFDITTSTYGSEVINLSGDLEYDTYFDGSLAGETFDSDGDGLDDADIILKALNLSGFSSNLGNIKLSLSSTPSTGQLEEITNFTSNWMDIPPS